MKQKRVLKKFKIICGYNEDDFINNMKTIAIKFLLNRQTKLRVWTMKVNPSVIQFDTKVVSMLVWNTFKSDLNIYR